MIMEADQSEDVPSARWIETQESRWCGSSLKASRPEILEEPIFQFKSKGGEKKQKHLSQLKGSQAGEVLRLLVPGYL